MFELLLTRHGETDWNVERRVMGAMAIPLNKAGRAQTRHLAKGLAKIPIHAIYTSPVKRAVQTAQIIMRRRGSIPLLEEKGLTEIDYGDWVGMAFAEVKELSGYFKKPSTINIPNGEDIHGAQNRAVLAVEKMREKHAGERVVAVSHADVIKLILVHYLNMPTDEMQKIGIDNCSVSILHFNSLKDPRIAAINYTTDLKKYYRL